MFQVCPLQSGTRLRQQGLWGGGEEEEEANRLLQESARD